MAKKITLTKGKIESNYGRTLDASIVFDVCDLTNEKTWCIYIDSSEGEYGGETISIEYINRKINNYLNK